MARYKNIARFKRTVISKAEQRQEQLNLINDVSLRKKARIIKANTIREYNKELTLTKSRIDVVNAMLKSLKKSDLYEESVAVDNLFSYLSANTIKVKRTPKRGLISTAGLDNKSIQTLVAINKAIDNFIKNRTSTVEGMKKLYEDRKEELKDYIDDEDFIDSLEYDDVKNIYSVFQSNQYDRAKSSFDSKSFFTLYTQAIDEKWNKSKFLKEVEYYVDYGNDEDLKGDIKSLYDDYIKKYAKR